MLRELNEKIIQRKLSFVTADGEYKFSLSDKSAENENFVDVYALVEHSKNGNLISKTDVKLCRLPAPISGNFIEDKGTLYRLVNGLIAKDGIYIVKTESGPTMKFSSKDNPRIRIQANREINNLKIFRFNQKERNEKGDTVQIHDLVFTFLIATGCVRDIDEYNMVMREAMSEMFVDYTVVKQSRGELAEYYLKSIFGRNTNGDPCKELEEIMFSSFVGTNNKWENKHVFFSFSRFMGCKLVNINGFSADNRIIDEIVAMELDSTKDIEFATLLIDGEEEKYYPDRTEGFSQDTLIKALKLFCLVLRHQDSVGYCDENAIYNRQFYMFFDYVSDYVESVMKTYSERGGNVQPQTTEEFFRYIENNCKKAKETVSVPNCISLDALSYSFTKDIFRSFESYKDIDKQVHPSYLIWISPSISSDGSKIGLTGCVNSEVINNNKLCRKFIVQEGGNPQRVEYLEPWQTYNKIIGIIDSKTGDIVNTLNGKVLAEKGAPPLMLMSDEIYDVLTGGIVSKNSNHAKRDVLGYKAINQSMSSIGNKSEPKLKTQLSGRTVGKTVREVLDEISDRSIDKNKIYTEDSKIKLLRAKQFPQDGDKTEEEDKFYLTISVDSRSYQYIALRYIMAATQNTRLYNKVCRPADNSDYYDLDETLISFGDYDEVGDELNVMFGNIDGSTYEDAVSVTSDFVDRLGFAIKVIFHEDLEISKTPKMIAEYNDELTLEQRNKLDDRGLPKKGKFFSVGEVMAKVKIVDDILYRNGEPIYKGKCKTLHSTKCGFVEQVQIKKFGNDKITEARIIISEVRKLRLGDKTGNGHGNKGVVMRVIDSSELSCNGRKIDMVINPLGTIGRMNIGQVKEMLSREICDKQGKSVTFKDMGTDHMTIEELVKELDKDNNYEEHEVFFKGNRIQNKFFVSKLKVYRTEHISSSKMSYIERPRLNINGVVDRGQRMSELCSLAYACYGADDVLSYLINYQSRTSSNYKIVHDNIVNGTESADFSDADITPYRVNAFMNCIGLKFNQEGISVLTEKDVKGLTAISSNSLQGDILHRESLHGKFNIDNKSSYSVKAKIVKPYKIIMPSILKSIADIIPVYRIELITDGVTTEREEVKESLSFKENGIGQKIIRGYVYLKLQPNSRIALVDKQTIVKANSSGTQKFDMNEWKTGYNELVDAIGKLTITDILTMSNNLLKQKSIDKANTLRTMYGDNFLKDICLTGIPVAPINLRPLYEGTKSAQGLDKIYRNIISETSPENMWTTLVALTQDINARLTAHGGSEEDRYLGVESHGEKMTELRDNMFARYYSNSSRTVAGYDFNIDIDTIAIPIVMAIGMVRNILISRVTKELDQEMYLDSMGMDKSTNYKPEINYRVSETLCKMVSGLTVDKDIKRIVMGQLQEIYSEIAVTMTREPVLRRQNIFAFKVIFTNDDCIKINPSVCSSYNMDFDGDQAGIQVILDKTISDRALDTMSPYNGIFDINTDETRFKPLQDILLGLYIMTKYKKTEKISRVYFVNTFKGMHNSFLPKSLHQVYQDIKDNRISLSDTVTIVDEYDCKHMNLRDCSVTDTVGNILFAGILLGEKFLSYQPATNDFLKMGSETITHINNSKVINLIADTLEGKEEILDSIKRMNLGSVWIYTLRGVTLSPRVLSLVDTLDQEHDYDGLGGNISLEDKVKKLTRNKSKQLFFMRSKSIEVKDSEDRIKKQIMGTEFFNDIVTSGARGKLGDFLAMYGSVGDIVVDNSTIRLNGNYNRGLCLTDKFYLSMPVRQSNVNVQNHLGVDGGKLRIMSVLASKLKISKSDKCLVKPSDHKIHYDVYIKGVHLAEIPSINISKDMELCKIYSTLLNEVEDFNVSGQMLENMVLDYNIEKVNGEEVDRVLSKFSKEFLRQKTVVYKGVECLGETILEDLNKHKPRNIKIYSMYNCTSEDGICKRCYGKMNKHLTKEEFRGNIGVNTIFDVGEGKFQATLDSAKNSKASSNKKSFNMFDIFVKSQLEQMPISVPSSHVVINKVSSDLYSVIVKDPERARTKAKVYLLSGAEIDTSYLRTGYFIPNTLSDYRQLNGNSDALSIVNNKFMKRLFDVCDIRSAETIMSISTRFMSRNSEIEEDDDETIVLTESIIPISELYNSGEYNRVWLTKSDVIAKSDIVTSLCLPNAFNNMHRNAICKRTYNANSVYHDKFAFKEIKEETTMRSLVNMLETLEKSRIQKSIELVEEDTTEEPVIILSSEEEPMPTLEEITLTSEF